MSVIKAAKGTLAGSCERLVYKRPTRRSRSRSAWSCSCSKVRCGAS